MLLCATHIPGLQHNPVAGRAPSEHDTTLRAVDNREPLCCRFVAGAPATGHTSSSGVRRSVSRVENSPIPKVIAQLCLCRWYIAHIPLVHRKSTLAVKCAKSEQTLTESGVAHSFPLLARLCGRRVLAAGIQPAWPIPALTTALGVAPRRTAGSSQPCEPLAQAFGSAVVSPSTVCSRAAATLQPRDPCGQLEAGGECDSCSAHFPSTQTQYT